LISTQADTSGREHATYFCLQTKSHAHWDMSGSLQKMMQKLGCDVIDYRQWHPNDHFGLAHCAITASRAVPSTRGHRTMTWVVSFSSSSDRDAPRRRE
jgi:hypothetical protein